MTDRTDGIAAARRGTGLARAALKQMAGLSAAILLVTLFADRFRDIDLSGISDAFRQVAAWQWLVALALTALSFWAIGRYDALIHRHLQTGTDRSIARRAGISAIAISQMAGMGLVTGALVRWRMLPGISLWQAARLTAAVAATFLAGWAVVTALAILVAPGAEVATLRPWAWLVLALASLAAAAASLLPPSSALARRLALPSLATMAAIFGLATLDTAAAAVALWALLPAGIDPGLAALLPAFLAALGAGLVLSTPGGIGPFELALLTLLPQMPQAELLAGVLAWRAVYFALPAMLAAIALARGPHPSAPAPAPFAAPETAAGLLARARRAETGLVHLGEHRLLLSGCAGAAMIVGETRQTLTALFDPFGADDALPDLFGRLRRTARDRGRMPCLYKLSPRAAAHARKAGWHLMPVADEAVIDLSAFDPAAPSRAGLRRKLRKARKAGVTIRADGPLPLPEMKRVAAEWAQARGGERGFSMGRFAPGYLSGQRVFRAEADGRLIAFASFHEGDGEWTLDLLRHGADCPDGAMHALVAAAIDAARASGIARMSLAAVTANARLARFLPTPLRGRLARRDAGCGLRRFKSSFAPRWQPLYLAAPSRPGLALALCDLALHIRRPSPLPASRSS